jgi:hypothetical protein
VRRSVVWSLAAVIIATSLAVGLLRLGTISGNVMPTPDPNDTHRDGVHHEDVQFGDTIYRLPVDKYLIGINPYNKARDHAAFTFNALLPDVTPASDDPVEATKWGKGTGWHRQIFGLVEYGRNFISPEQMLEKEFESSRDMKAFADKHYATTLSDLIYLDRTKFSTLPNGCRKYEGETGLNANVLQVCENGGDMVLVECATGNTHIHIPSPSCSVHTNIADKTELTYHYGFNYFELALDIHLKLRALIESFRMNRLAVTHNKGDL